MGDIQHDPSMEEILASIKKVIREDARAPGQAPRAARARPTRSEPFPPPPAAAPSEEDVLELDDPIESDGGLLSSDAAAASRQSLAALSAAREAEGGPLEAMIRDMLRPALKDWLDEHLPRIVEELVTREIARITGRKI